MQPHTETLNLIRQITEDGVITEDEVMELGNFLNSDRDARQAWPGNILFEILKRIFDDAKVDEAEMKSLGYILKGIELQCTGTFGVREEEVKDEFPADTQVKQTEIVIPPIEYSVTVKSPDGEDAEFQVDLTKQTCGCADFQDRRKKLPFGSPGRICKHMLFALLDSAGEEHISASTWHRTMVQVFNHLVNINRAADVFPNWELVQAPNRDWIVCWGKGEWCVVFTNSETDAIERYAFNINESRWAYGRIPTGSRVIQNLFLRKGAVQPAKVPGV